MQIKKIAVSAAIVAAIAMEGVLPKPTRLTCACCGSETRGRQWHNRDKGYGLCPDCIEFVSKNETPEAVESMYGKRGTHYDLPGDDK